MKPKGYKGRVLLIPWLTNPDIKHCVLYIYSVN